MSDGEDFYPAGGAERDLSPYGYRAEVRNVTRDATRDLRALVAVDLPSPLEYANSLRVLFPELARVIMSARFTPNGWRIRLAADDPALRALRSLGLVEVRGFDPSPADQVAGLGTHLSGYGRAVMRALQANRRAGPQ